MKLSDHFNRKNIIKDNFFLTLGYVDSNILGTLTYCETEHHLKAAISNDNITGIITRPDLSGIVKNDIGLVSSGEPRNFFYKLHNLLFQNNKTYGLHLSDTGIGKKCIVAPSAIVSKKVQIGNNCTISENVVIMDGTIIGDNCFVDAGVVVGSEGLLYYFEDEKPIRVNHAGGVTIGKNASLLAGTVIVKSVHESFLTQVGENSIIGVNTTIGHEAIIGNSCIFSSNCVIARRTQIGDNTFIGPSSTIREHVIIGADAKIRLGSVAIENVDSQKDVSGNFAIDHKKNLKHFVKTYKNL